MIILHSITSSNLLHCLMFIYSFILSLGQSHNEGKHLTNRNIIRTNSITVSSNISRNDIFHLFRWCGVLNKRLERNKKKGWSGVGKVWLRLNKCVFEGFSMIFWLNYNSSADPLFHLRKLTPAEKNLL